MATVYINNDGSGDDSRSNATAQNPATPWAGLNATTQAKIANGDLVAIKNTGTNYTLTTGITLSTGTGGVTYGTKTRIVGYTSSVGDGGRPTFDTTTASLTLFTISGSGWSLENLIIDGKSTSSVKGVNITGNYDNSIYNCTVKNCPSNGIQSAGLVWSVVNCEVTGCAGNGGIYATNGPGLVFGSHIHDNTVTGVLNTAAGIVVLSSLIANNTGSTSDGIQLNGYPTYASGNTIYGNGRHGIYLSVYHLVAVIDDNILVNNGASGTGYGISTPISPAAQCVNILRNAFYGNATGARVANLSAGPGDVTLTGVPFTNAAGGDFSLNNVSGQGAACRAAGFPGTLLGSSTTGYFDIGAVQHRNPGFPLNVLRSGPSWAYVG